MIAIIIFITLAAAGKSIADTLKWNFEISIFSRLKQVFWNPAVSYLNAPIIRFTKYRVDAWHLFNSLFIVCFILAAVFNDMPYKWWLQVIGIGIYYNGVFEILIRWVWKRKQYRN